MRVKDLMNPEVVTVHCDQPLSEVVELFKERCITGAPVVDDTGTVLGVISQTDLMLARGSEVVGVARFHVEPEPLEGGETVTVTEIGTATAENVMTPGAIAVDEGATVEAAARAMLDSHIHRVLVTRDGKLAGILTTMDLMKVLVDAAPARKPAAAKKAKAPARRHGKKAK